MGLRLWGALLARAVYEDDAVDWIPPATVERIQREAIARCDALHGVADGLVGNPDACHRGSAAALDDAALAAAIRAQGASWGSRLPILPLLRDPWPRPWWRALRAAIGEPLCTRRLGGARRAARWRGHHRWHAERNAEAHPPALSFSHMAKTHGQWRCARSGKLPLHRRIAEAEAQAGAVGSAPPSAASDSPPRSQRRQVLGRGAKLAKDLLGMLAAARRAPA